MVIGAGPAGTAAAYWLARGGAEVRLLEKERMPRRKLCSGVLTVWSEREVASIRPDIEERAPKLGVGHSTRFFAPSGTAHVSHRATGWVDRAAFDHALAEAAEGAGADVRDGVRVSQAEIDGWLAEGTLVVAADGANSASARRLQPQGVRLLGMEAIVPYEGRIDRIVLDFRLEGGYHWIFPRQDGTAGIGGVTSESGIWPALAERVRVFAHSHGAGVPAAVDGHAMRYVHGARVARAGLFLAGEAAGAMDMVLGEGIRFALISGRLVAQAMLAGQGAEQRYEALYARYVARLLLFRERFLRLRQTHPVPFLRGLHTPLLREAAASHFLGRP